MNSHYKPLGNYIREVDIRDANAEVDLLLGVSIKKKFIPSIANTVGTDMSTYKVVKKHQFAYGPVTSRNGDKVSIALRNDHEEAVVSQAYTTFEVIDHEELEPEYLMMWFRRPEFDRYARFMSHGSAREIFGWQEMCSTTMPVPHIDIQRKVVREYKAVLDRIALNQRMADTLQETAHTIYKRWFVDFEFPSEGGVPYKTSGGTMVESEFGDIPEGWEVTEIKSFGQIITGKTPSSENPEDFGNAMPFVTPGDFENYDKFAVGAERGLSDSGIKTLKNKVLEKNSVIVTCIGSDMGKVVVASEACVTNQQMNSIAVSNHFFADYLYYSLKSISTELKSIALGSSTMPMLSKSEFERIKILKPADDVLELFSGLVEPLNGHLLINSRIRNASQLLKQTLLSKLATMQD